MNNATNVSELTTEELMDIQGGSVLQTIAEWILKEINRDVVNF